MHTDLDNIEKLLAKYLEAKTNLQEENLLKTYFTGNTVASHLQEYQYMFQYFATSKSERYTKSIRLKSNRNRRKWFSLAASLLILLGLISYNRYQKHKIDKAYNDTQMALQIIATQINKGTIAIAELNKIEETTHKVFKKK
jgi:hypothetical protein